MFVNQPIFAISVRNITVVLTVIWKLKQTKIDNRYRQRDKKLQANQTQD